MSTTTEVTVYQNIKDPITAMVAMGSMIAKSQVFGCSSQAQGELLALECMARQCLPLDLAAEFHFIQGRLSMKASAMQAAFELAKGEIDIKEYSTEACEIVFKRGKNTLPIRITWEDAQKEKWPYGKDGKTLKDNWATPIGRQDMLWARVISRGVRRLAPGVVGGQYTPEEVQDFPELENLTVAGTVVEKIKVTKPELTTLENGLVNGFSPEDSAVDAEFETTESVDVVPESNEVDGPISSDMVEQIKKSIVHAAQLGLGDLADKIKEKLVSVGLSKISDLSRLEAIELKRAIEIKSLGAWLDNPVVGHAAIESATEDVAGK